MRYRLAFQLPYESQTIRYLDGSDMWGVLYDAMKAVLNDRYRSEGVLPVERPVRVLFAPRLFEGDIAVILSDNGETRHIGTLEACIEGGCKELHDPYDTARFREEYLHDLADADCQEDEE